MSFWRKLTAGYSWLLSWLLVISVAILIIPVSLQIFSRYTALIPSYIWTEEMARFLFIWMIMIGAMIGVREGTHFEVDLWPRAWTACGGCGEARGKPWRARARAGVRVGRHRVHALRLEPFFGTGRTAAWMIHVAWPLTGFTWFVFLGEQMWDNLGSHARAARMSEPPGRPKASDVPLEGTARSARGQQ